ncbi:unnamed protein product, partial [Mesorhabditis spiculigera]
MVGAMVNKYTSLATQPTVVEVPKPEPAKPASASAPASEPEKPKAEEPVVKKESETSPAPNEPGRRSVKKAKSKPAAKPGDPAAVELLQDAKTQRSLTIKERRTKPSKQSHGKHKKGPKDGTQHKTEESVDDDTLRLIPSLPQDLRAPETQEADEGEEEPKTDLDATANFPAVGALLSKFRSGRLLKPSKEPDNKEQKTGTKKRALGSRESVRTGRQMSRDSQRTGRQKPRAGGSREREGAEKSGKKPPPPSQIQQQRQPTPPPPQTAPVEDPQPITAAHQPPKPEGHPGDDMKTGHQGATARSGKVVKE